MAGPPVTAGRALEAALDAMHGLAADALVTELRQHMERLAQNPIREAESLAAQEAYEAALLDYEADPPGSRRPEDKPKAPPAFVPYTIPPQFLDKVLKFLAQNGINAPATSPKVDALARRLNDLNLDDEARAH